MPRCAWMLAAVIVAGFVAPAVVYGQKPEEKPAEKSDKTAGEQKKDEKKDEKKAPEEKAVQTKHTIKLGGQEIKYTATAGTILLKLEDGTPKASVFYIAYTKDDVSDVAKRPLTFAFIYRASRRGDLPGGQAGRADCRDR